MPASIAAQNGWKEKLFAAGAIAKLRSNGAHVMLEQFNNGRHVAFIEAPDGAQMELIEKV